MPELQFLSQKSLQHSHFLCIVMCAVLCKSKFPSKQCNTPIFISVFPFTLLQNLLSFFQKIWLPELQFLSQKSLKHSHFLCVVAMCAVFCKRRFPNKFTCKMPLTFSRRTFLQKHLKYWRNNTTVFAVYNFCNEGKLQLRKNRRNLCLISVCKHLLLCYNIFTTEKNCG